MEALLTLNHRVTRSTDDGSRDLLKAVAVVCLGGALSDGYSDPSELRLFIRDFRKMFLVTSKDARRAVFDAVRLVSEVKGDMSVVLESCDTISNYMTRSQRADVLIILMAIIMSDRKLLSTEIAYYEIVSARLGFSGRSARSLSLVN